MATSSTQKSLSSSGLVELLVELQEATGRVHEIGSRADVLQVEGDALTLSIRDHHGESVVSCFRTDVVAVDRQRRSRRSPWRPGRAIATA